MNFVCTTPERFFAVSNVLKNMVAALREMPSVDVRLLKYIIRCYLRLSDHGRGRATLRDSIPDLLVNPDFTSCLSSHDQARRYVPSLALFIPP